MDREEIEGIEVEDASEQEEEEESFSHARYLINSYGVDYTVDTLVKRYEDGAIVIPEFQRKYVWSFGQACRFIDSLLRGLPVPGIFMSKDEERRLIVIDGQQRLVTLADFYGGVFQGTRPFALVNSDERFDGKTYRTLAEEDRRQLDDSILHATIIEQLEPEDDDSSMYHIFERLNTTGLKLNPQEIRNVIYRGEFRQLLRDLNGFEPWRAVYGAESKRAKDQELILRFLALLYASDSYGKPMKEFLNWFMFEHRDVDAKTSNEFRSVFKATIGVVGECLGRKAFRPIRGLNAAVFDAVMVGIARRLEKGRIKDLDGLKWQYFDLLDNERFIDAYTSSTTDVENVRARLELATAAFGGVG